MDFDIDAVLDQLEKTLNQSDHEEKETNPIVQTSPPTSTSKKLIDDLLLLDLDPLGSVENQHNNNDQDNDEKLARFRQDLEELYATSTVFEPPQTIATPTLPDIIGQQEEFPSTSLPLAVEQLELEVRQEILQHTLDEPSPPSLLLPDLTTVSYSNQEESKETSLLSISIEEEENLSSTPVPETVDPSNNILHQNEPDLIQHETTPTQAPVILHSVDSIVNLPTISDLASFRVPNPALVEIEPLQTSSELVFGACEDDDDDDDDQESSQPLSEEPRADSPTSSPPPSPSPITPTAATTQDFDLVKNVLSEIFDKSDGEILDENLVEETESELVNIEQLAISPPEIQTPTTANNEDDFRFLDEMLATLDVSDADIHQLTPAEMDRVDNLLKGIVNAQQTEETAPPPRSTTDEVESSLPPDEERPATSSVESSLGLASSSTAAAMPIDEELIRVEQEWAKLSEEEKRLGSIAPEWVSDDLAPACMKCAAKFSITRRRHHCRACGKVFCSTCCWQKVKLIHDDSKEDRACNDCVRTINNVEYLWNYMRNNQKPRSSVLRKKTGNLFV